jgi:hypothetical protein
VEVSRFISFGEEAQAFLEGLNRTGQPIKKNLAKLLALHDQYGTADLIQALKRANAHNAYGAAYVQNILHQENTQKNHPRCTETGGLKPHPFGGAPPSMTPYPQAQGQHVDLKP